MKNKTVNRFILSFCLVAFMAQISFALTDAAPVENVESANRTQYAKVQYNAKEFKKNLENINNKFVNLNIQASYDDLSRAIFDNEGNDYYIMTLADKSVALGFFDLADVAFSKISDYEISNIDSENSRKLFFPKYNMTTKDIIFLAEAYSNIQYNDRSDEAVKSICSNSENLEKNDYANYILALGYLKLNDIDNAKLYIDKAISINSNNLNYKILQSQIVANTKRNKKALKIVKETKNDKNIGYYPIRKQIFANEQYIKYKTERQPWLKDYYLGYYYYLNDDNSKALRVLQSAISKNNSRNALLYSLMGRIYVKNGDYELASIVASKAYKYNLSNVDTLLTLGDIEYQNNRYKQALKYYKQASKSRDLANEAKLKLADTYSKLNNINSSKAIYKKLIKKDNTAYEAYYNISMYEPESELAYLKKTVAINPNFKDAWIDLSKLMIEKGNLALARKYLDNAYYIDENDFRYYYYQSLLVKKNEELNKVGK